MRNDERNLQIRLSEQTVKELRTISSQMGMTSADVIRGALYFGLPVFASMSDVREKLIKRLISVLKKDARKRPKSTK